MLRHAMTMMRTIILCGATLCGACAGAQAQQLQPVAAFQAGQLLGGQILQGNQTSAQQMVAPFLGAFHVAVVDQQYGQRLWEIVTADGRNLIALCQVQDDPQDGSLLFGGQITLGLPQFYNGSLVGKIVQDPQAGLVVGMRVQSQAGDVEFWQPLQQVQSASAAPPASGGGSSGYGSGSGSGDYSAEPDDPYSFENGWSTGFGNPYWSWDN